VVGGAATYASLAASLLPVQESLRGGRGLRRSEIDALANRNIDTTGIERVKGGKTFHWAGRYDAKLASRTTLDTQLNVFANFRPKLPKSYKTSEFLLLANIHPALQLEVLDQVEGPKLVLADTMNYWIEGSRSCWRRFCRGWTCCASTMKRPGSCQVFTPAEGRAQYSAARPQETDHQARRAWGDALRRQGSVLCSGGAA